MRYVARLVVVFSAERARSATFEAWEHTVTFAADDLRQALSTAISTSRSVLDDPANCKVLGYNDKPVLYAIIWVDPEERHPFGKTTLGDGHVLLTMIASLTEQDLETFKTRRKLSISVGAIIIDP
jgi:hypothetical protein